MAARYFEVLIYLSINKGETIMGKRRLLEILWYLATTDIKSPLDVLCHI